MNEYLIIVKENEAEHAKASAHALSQLFEERAAYRAQLQKSGVFLDGERFRVSSEGKRVQERGGKLRVEAGPFADAISTYWAVKAETLDDAVALAKLCPTLAGDELEVRPVMKGGCDSEKSARTGKVFAFSVLGNSPNEEAWIRVMNRIDEQTSADAFFPEGFLGGLRLEAPRTGRRIVTQKGKPVVFDGPFLESKEVIGGLFFMRLPSMEDAVEWVSTTPFVKLGGAEIRELWRS